MGLRYRKSYNFKGFRINFSKSGIGYSYGIPGLRYTVTANGKQRLTSSIPGTGISYVKEFGGKSKDNILETDYSNYEKIQNIDINYSTVEYSELINECQRWLNAWYTNKKLIIYTNVISVLILFILFIFSSNIFVYAIILFITIFIVNFVGIYNLIYLSSNKINFDYEFNVKDNLYEKLLNLLKNEPKSEKIWYIENIVNNIEKRKNAGAVRSVDLRKLIITNDTPCFMTTNVKCFNLKFLNENIYILPDKVLILKQKRVTAINLKSINIELNTEIFSEFGELASDSEVLYYTWKYVNNNGTPDRRFKDNKQIPVCKYGQIDISSSDGLHVVVMTSNYYNAIEFYRKWLIFSNVLNKTYKIYNNLNKKDRIFENSDSDLDFNESSDGIMYYNFNYSGSAYLLSDEYNGNYDRKYLILNKNKLYAFGKNNINNLKKINSRDLILLNEKDKGLIAIGTSTGKSYISIDDNIYSLELSNILKLDEPVTINELQLMLGESFESGGNLQFISLDTIRLIIEKVESNIRKTLV